MSLLNKFRTRKLCSRNQPCHERDHSSWWDRSLRQGISLLLTYQHKERHTSRNHLQLDYQKHISTFVNVYSHTYLHLYIWLEYIHLHVCMCEHMKMHTYIRTCKYVNRLMIYIYICTHSIICAGSLLLWIRRSHFLLHVSSHIIPYCCYRTIYTFVILLHNCNLPLLTPSSYSCHNLLIRVILLLWHV